MTVDLTPIRARLETDLGDPALEALYNAQRETVDELLGPIGPITEHRTPAGPLFGLSRRAVEVLEVIENRVALEAEDWRLRPSGLLVERLGRMRWHGEAAITYQPLPDAALREQTIVALIKLELAHNPGLVSAKFGSWAESYAQPGGKTYGEQRADILSALVANDGMFR